MLEKQPLAPLAHTPDCLMSALHAPDRPTVIVADDDADMRAYIVHALRTQMVAHEADDGDEALRLVRALAPDLVIADLHMPGLNSLPRSSGGLALCRALKCDVATAAIPILLISGQRRAPPPEADGFLTKPFNAAGLRAHVERLFALPL